jgi:hypothetical protein
MDIQHVLSPIFTYTMPRVGKWTRVEVAGMLIARPSMPKTALAFPSKGCTSHVMFHDKYRENVGYVAVVVSAVYTFTYMYLLV